MLLAPLLLIERVGTHGRVQARIGIAKERSITHGRVIGRQRYYLKEPTRRWRCCSTDSVGEHRADAYSGIFACDIEKERTSAYACIEVAAKDGLE